MKNRNRNIAWGGEIAKTQVQMFTEAIRNIFIIVVGADIAFFLIWTAKTISIKQLWQFYIHNIIRFGLPTLLGHGRQVVYLGQAAYTKSALFQAVWQDLIKHYHHFGIYTLAIDIILTVLAIYVFKTITHNTQKEKVIRGREIQDVKKLAKSLPKPRRLPMLQKLELPIEYETKHIIIAGKTGTGKTTAMSQKLQKLRDENIEKVIVYDYKGDYIQKFYRPDIDYLFNPLDERCLKWNIYNDIASRIDIATLVESLFPIIKEGSNSSYWKTGAQLILSSILEVLWKDGKTSNKHIWEVLSMGKIGVYDFLSEYKSITAAALSFIDKDAGPQASGVLSSTMEHTKIFREMAMIDGDFSLKDWINKDKGWLFVSNTPLADQMLLPALSMVINTLIKRILSLPDDVNRRIFFFLDEFATLQPLPSLIKFITLARSKGGVAVLGLQDLGRVQKLYGREETKTIINNTGNLLLFSVEGETAEEFAKVLGEQETISSRVSYMFGPSRVRDGVTSSTEQKTKKLFLPSELSMLKQFEAVCRLAEGQVTKGMIEKKFIEVQQNIIPFQEAKEVTDIESKKELDETKNEDKQWSNY